MEGRRSAAESAREDAEGSQGLSLEERGRRVESACRAAWEILTSRRDFPRVLGILDPRTPESEALWRSLVRKYRSRLRGA
jgi:hypothetical protein